jgi:hypothetical protein
MALACVSSLAACPWPASAATLMILTDPVTMGRRMVVLDPNGPDRLLMCSTPPSVAGCQQFPLKRRR